ncbi:rRNA pseudouridine synthase [Candidatus Kaiserbacteria bacterium]|nr:rRNA pseudouridine synthase [Candidatus Kaiserbacteria bacterium]
MSELIRINKRIAELGLASRREADALIAAGSVLVNGRPAVTGEKVSLSDTIEVRGNSTKEKLYLAYYKGRGIITHSPAANETDIVTRLKSDYDLTDVYPVGRLDKDSEGLIILTNDGRVTGPLLDPARGNSKVYEVTVDKPINNHFLKHMASGVNIEGYVTKPANIEKKTNVRFLLTLTEGKKHQIRRMCAALGYQVESLKRVQILNIELGKLKPNQYRKLSGSELKTFLKTLGVS